MRDNAANFDLSELLLEHVPAAVAVFDTQMRYLACSRRWLVDYCLEAGNISGRSHYELFPEIDEHWRAIHVRALAGESLSSDMEPFARIDGSTDWVRWSMIPWRARSGEIGGAVLFTEILNELVRNRQQVRTYAAELSLLADSVSGYAIFLLDTAGRVSVWNRGAERLYGWRESEVVGQPYDMMFEPGDRDAGMPRRQLEAATRDGAFRVRARRMRKDGCCFPADVTVSRLLDDTGAVVGFGKVVRDITEETARVSETEANEALLHSILDTVPEAMITIDEHGVILSFSAAAEKLFGYAPEEVLGHSVSKLMPEPDAAHHDDHLAKYRETGRKTIIGNTRRVMGRRKDGSTFAHELNVGEAWGGGKRVFTGFVRDLTAQEEADQRLREVQSELIHISRVSALGTMATALAHELNQPLTAIANYVQTCAAILSAEADTALAVVREALEEAGREALRAGTIIQRLRDFVARGELDRANSNARDLAIQACALGAVGGKSRGITCSVLMSDDLPMVMVDRVQVQQVLVNLVRNAVQALTDGGTIIVTAQSEGDMLRVSVIDDGPGIAADRQHDLFEPFISGKAGGMGLGLAICRTIIEAHGGRLWTEAATDSGAAFHFTLPVSEENHGPVSEGNHG